MRHLLLIESFDSSDRIGNASSCDSGTGKFVVTPAMERSLEGKIHLYSFVFFFSSRRRHTRCSRDWSSDVCSSDLVPLAKLVLADPTTPLRSLTQEPLISAHAGASEKEVAELFDKYNLVTLPVVDDDKKLTGVITSDDVISLLRAKL